MQRPSALAAAVLLKRCLRGAVPVLALRLLGGVRDAARGERNPGLGEATARAAEVLKASARLLYAARRQSYASTGKTQEQPVLVPQSRHV
jgi:hypothetical protein